MARLAPRLAFPAACFVLVVAILAGCGANAPTPMISVAQPAQAGEKPAAKSSGDWPQFRGPNRDGVSSEKGLLAKWPDAGPKLEWKFDKAGLGFSSVSIVDGKLYTLGTRDNNEIFLAIDAAKGTELWSLPIAPIFTFEGNVWGDGPRGTPTIDGGKAYALGGQGILVAIDLANKKELWRKDLLKDFGGVVMTEWGYSESPLIEGDMVIVTPGGDKGLLLALDKNTGKTLWQTKDVPHKAPYSSAMPMDVGGVRQIVQNSYDATGGFLNGFDAKTGKLLWQEQTLKGSSYAIAPTPIVKGNVVYVTSGYGAGCHAYEVTAKGATELYAKKEQKTTKNTHGGVVLIDGCIYGHSETLGWICQDLDQAKPKGKILWKERDTLETKSGSITAADGKLYLYTEEGNVALAEASPKAFTIVSEFKLPAMSDYPNKLKTSKASKAWSYPVISNGNLYIRDCELIYCYKVK